ncbi:hypothetical protein [Citrobacter youngae]|uniref:hypothetical protein n=1 Tax=Citrobacter youngae TaxID=133448 RepID=UPI003EE2F5AC
MTVKTAPVPDRQTLHHPARHFRCAKQQSDVASHHHDSPLSTPTDSDGNPLTHPETENITIMKSTHRTTGTGPAKARNE